MNEVTINGKVYVPKDQNTEGMEYCIVRTYSAGAFAGFLESTDGDEVIIINSRRLWRWAGAASLSELAVKGTSKPDECKFPCEEPRKRIKGWIEITPCSQVAIDSIKGVPEWSAR